MECTLYNATMGPTKTGDYFQLTCQGMKPTAGKLGVFRLDEVNEKLRRSGIIDPETPLPEYA